ncbi:MAG: hypothetical protein QM655_12595 [Nocardioidaceae bacterium]
MTEQTTQTQIPTVSEDSAADVINSFTGFDEIAVARAFGQDISEMPPMRMHRAALFVLARRSGAKDGEAYKTAMGMTAAGVSDYFPRPESDLDPFAEDQPGLDSDAGKGDTPST